MRFDRVIAAVAILPFVCAATAQPRGRLGNPVAGNPEAIETGEKLYSARCAVCHGRDARGGEAPSLHKSRLVVLSPDLRFFEVVKQGIPGTEMPPMPGPDEPIWRIVAFVHSIAKPGLGPPVPGDPDAGREVFRAAGCGRCHIVEGKGGVVGPDLSSVAVQSSSAEIRESILDPNLKVAAVFHAVTVQTKAGQAMEGTLKNEDNFSLQVMTMGGQLLAFLRKDLATVRIERKSLMPADVGKRLSPDELQNLLAFLDRQRAPVLRSQIGFQNY